MWNKLKALFEFSASHGLNLPSAYDKDKDGPSITLFFSHISFCLTLCTIIYLFFKPDVITPVASATTLFVICIILYRMRKIDSFKVDLDDRELEFTGHDDQEKGK